MVQLLSMVCWILNSGSVTVPLCHYAVARQQNVAVVKSRQSLCPLEQRTLRRRGMMVIRLVMDLLLRRPTLEMMMMMTKMMMKRDNVSERHALQPAHSPAVHSTAQRSAPCTGNASLEPCTWLSPAHNTPTSNIIKWIYASVLSVCLSVHLSPKCLHKNETFLETKHGLYWRPVGSPTWALQRTRYWTPKIQDGGRPPYWKSSLDIT